MSDGSSTALFLGTGTSTGVPLIGCHCRVCESNDLRDRRLRSGLLLRREGFHLLVDTPPDLREQALRYGISRIDAVFLTHPHVDHLFGLDDLRRFNVVQGQTIPVYASPETLSSVRRIFEYLFRPSLPGTFLPDLSFHPLEPDGSGVEVGPFVVRPFDVVHGLSRTYGYRFDDGHGSGLAYASDCKAFPDEALAAVRGVGAMVLDGLRPEPHASHLSFDESADVLREIDADRSWFTHIGHGLSHAEIEERYAPAGIEPAHDGLLVEW